MRSPAFRVRIRPAVEVVRQSYGKLIALGRHVMKRIGIVAMLALAVLASGRPRLHAEESPAATTRSVNIAAVDAKGGIVTDLTAADLTV